MVEGGGFCEKHGPYDPPHRTCPFCAIENQQRQAYGPPQPAPDREMPAGFRRQTVEPEPKPEPEPPVELTEVVSPRPASEGDRAPLGWLIIKEPVEQRGTVLAVRANQIIGRNGDVQWNDPRLSRQHARLTFEPPEGAPDDPSVFHLWPFGPANPVYINGREIRGATPLHENDEVRLGGTVFVFKVLID